jgi:hypothetical protein
MQQQRRRRDAVCCRCRCRRGGARWRRCYRVFLMHEKPRRRKTEKLRSLDSGPVVGGEVWSLAWDLNGNRHSGRDDPCNNEKNSLVSEEENVRSPQWHYRQFTCAVSHILTAVKYAFARLHGGIFLKFILRLPLNVCLSALRTQHHRRLWVFYRFGKRFSCHVQG